MKERWRPYYIAVPKENEATLERTLKEAGFFHFIVGDAEEFASMEEIERKHAPSTADFQTPKERRA
jgi:hypothetical protein